MLRRIAIAALALGLMPQTHASLETDCIWEGGVWAPTVWESDVWDECGGSGPELFSLTNVVGQASAAAADTLLEAAGFDLDTETPVCSAATDNSIVSQTPAAGTLVAAGTTVDVNSADPTLCVPAESGAGKPGVRLRGMRMPGL